MEENSKGLNPINAAELCSNYADLRLQLFNAIAPFIYPSMSIIQCVNQQLDKNINFDKFDAVHSSYIIRSKRFEENTSVFLQPPGQSDGQPSYALIKGKIPLYSIMYFG